LGYVNQFDQDLGGKCRQRFCSADKLTFKSN